MKASVASTSEVLPEAELLWIKTESGRGKCRETQAR